MPHAEGYSKEFENMSLFYPMKSSICIKVNSLYVLCASSLLDKIINATNKKEKGG